MNNKLFKKVKDKTSERKEEKVNTMKLYGDLLYSFMTRGQTEKILDLDNVSNQIGFNRKVSHNYISYYIQISSMGSDMVPNLLSSIRNRVKLGSTHKIYVDLVTRSRGHKVKWNSSTMKTNVKMWKTTRKKKNNQEQINSEEGYSSSLTDMEVSWENRREGSWEYYKQCERRGTELSLTGFVFRIRMHKEDKVYLKLLFESLGEVFAKHNLRAKVINTYIYDAISEMSPFKHEGTKLASKLIADRVLSTEITSKISPLTQGKLNTGSLVLGNDQKNRQLTRIDLHPKNGKGTNIIMLATTGGGKSVIGKVLNEQILAIGDYLYIVDYEGNEYTPFGDAYGATYLDYGGDDGKYYEPLRLTSLTGIKEIDSTIVQNSINAVFMLTSILVGKPLTARQKKLIGKATIEYAKGKGVDFQDSNTWKSSSELTIKGLLPKLRNYNASRDMRNEYGSDLTELVDTFELYFEGIYSYMFTNPVSFEELSDSRLVIIRFGGDSKEELVGEDSIDIQVKQLTTMLLLQELSRYRRAKDQSFVIQLEELQRYLKHRGSGPWVNTMYTGVRKCNGTMMGIINDPEQLKEGLSALINNSEYVIVGKTEDMNAMKYMFETPKLRGCEDLVRSLSTMEHCFLIRNLEGLCSIFRAELPNKYLESPIFKTRTN